MIMNREITNPDYRFLFENQSPAHVYYRWKIFSMLQGESPSRWSTKPFRMFKGGSIWKPPPLNPFLQGMPEELIRQEEIEDEKNKKGSLSNAQRGRLESMIRTLTPERVMIGEAMVWCIEHADAAEEICQCITEACTNIDTMASKKIARLYLVSDILHNCSVKVQNASFYRKGLQARLAEIFEGLHIAYNAIESRLRAEQVKQRVMQCCRAWEDWTIYPHEFLIHLQNLFLGLVKRSSPWRVEEDEDMKPSLDGAPLGDDFDGIPIEDVDGIPMNNAEDKEGVISDIDGLPLTTPLINKSAAISALMGYDDDEDDEDIDGAPLDDDVDGLPLRHDGSALVETGTAPGFVSSKWESVSPKRVEAQAVTTSKWETLEDKQSDAEGSGSDSTPVYDQPSDKETNNSPGDSPDYTNYQNTKMPPPNKEDDLDGIPLEYEDFKRRSKDSTDDDDEEEDDFQSQDNGSEYSEEARGVDRLGQGSEAEEERRAKLREIEVRVMQYQDELEQGIRKVKAGYSISHQVQHFRRKLVKKIARDEGRHRRHRSRSASPGETPKRSRSKRSKSPHRVEEIHESTNSSSKKSRGSPGRSQKWEKKDRSQSSKRQHHNSDESRRDDSPKNSYAKREVLSTGKYKHERKEKIEKEKNQESKDGNNRGHRHSSKSRSPRSHTPGHRSSSRTPRKRRSHSKSPPRKHKKKRH